MEYSGICANEIVLLEPSLHEMELFALTADSDFDHSFNEFSVQRSQT